MSIHVGQLIKQKVKSNRIRHKDLYEKLNTSRQNLYAIFKRETIDTGILLNLSEIIHYNFFKDFIAEEPLKSMEKEEQQKLKAAEQKLLQEIGILKSEIALKEKHIKSLEETVAAQKKLIRLIEKTPPLKTGRPKK